MEKGNNFRTQKGQEDYFKAYDETLQLWNVSYSEQYIETTFGKTHCLISGQANLSPLILLHAASCGSTIWYKNIEALSQKYRVYAIDLITEASKSILTSKIKTPNQCAVWLNEVIEGLHLDKIYLCGLSIGGWNAVNYAITFPHKVNKLILLSPIQTLAKMHLGFFIKILKMGFKPTRQNIENYIGWGNTNEAPLPNSIIEQFTISVMNMNPNAVFPKMIKTRDLGLLKMPVMVLLGKHEFAFSINKALLNAKKHLTDLDIQIIENASHLIPVSSPNITNEKIIDFLH